MSTDSKMSAAVPTYGPKTGQCAVCGKAGSQACSRCRVDFYCGKEHQTRDWPRHRQGCGCLKLRSDPQLGRYVVATRDIPAGTVLMREVPLVVVPRPEDLIRTNLCVGCCKVVKVVTTRRSCSKCGWPVCSDACSRLEAHAAECAVFERVKLKERKAPRPIWACNSLAALRVCLAATGDSPRAALLRGMQSDQPPAQEARQQVRDPSDFSRGDYLRSMLEERQFFAQKCDEAVKWLVEELGVSWLPADALRRSVGSLFINGVPVSDGLAISAAGLFAGVSKLEHSCAPNTEVVPWSDLTVDTEHVLVATRDVARGEHLTLAYRSDDMYSAVQRRLKLLWWGFLCRCELCQDPRQKGLRMDGWCCRSCSTPTKPHPVLVLSPLRWVCDGCGRDSSKANGKASGEALSPADRLSSGLAEADEADRLDQRFVDMEDNQVPRAEWERFVEEALWPRGPLHANHHLILKAKEHALVLNDHRDAVSMFMGLGEDALRRLCGYGRDLQQVLKVVRPGRHHEICRALVRRLEELTMFRFAWSTGGAGKAKKDGKRDAHKRLLKQAKILDAEVTELVLEMKAAAVTPAEKEYAQATWDGLEKMRPLMLQLR